MAAIRHILVPVDFSEPSREALEYAAGLAKQFGATLDVLHVWEAPSFVVPGSGMVSGTSSEISMHELIRKDAEQALDAFVREAGKRRIEVRSARAERGHPANAIVEAASDGSYDLIVIGTHGRTGLARALVGSVAERVVRLARCPVLSVRRPTNSSRAS